MDFCFDVVTDSLAGTQERNRRPNQHFVRDFEQKVGGIYKKMTVR